MSPEYASILLEVDLYSDGQPWDPERAVRQIDTEVRSILVSADRIGRVLCHAKAHLGHGAFTEWVEANLPFSTHTARRYMQVAEFFVAHPRLRDQLRGAKLRNLLLLTSLPAELRDELIQDGHVAQVPAEELGTMPYTELRKRMEKAESDLSEARSAEDRLQRKLQERDLQVAELATRSIGVQSSKIRSELDVLRARFEHAFDAMGLLLDHAAARWEELDPATRAQLDGLVGWIRIMVAHEDLAHRTRRGDDQPAYELDDVLMESRTLPDDFQIPDHRKLHTFGASDDAPAPRGRGGLVVVDGQDLVPADQVPPKPNTRKRKG